MDDVISVAGLGVSAAGLIMVLIMVWPIPVEPEPEPAHARPRDEIGVMCDDLERTLEAGRDYQSDRVAVVREMPGLWTVWLDGHPHERTARSPYQARSIAETHLRMVLDRRPRRRGGHTVGASHESRVGRVRRDWRHDIVP